MTFLSLSKWYPLNTVSAADSQWSQINAAVINGSLADVQLLMPKKPSQISKERLRNTIRIANETNHLEIVNFLTNKWFQILNLHSRQAAKKSPVQALDEA